MHSSEQICIWWSAAGSLWKSVWRKKKAKVMLKGFRRGKLPFCFLIWNHHNSQVSDLLALAGELRLSSLGSAANSFRCRRSCTSHEDRWVKFLRLSWPQPFDFLETEIDTPVTSNVRSIWQAFHKTQSRLPRLVTIEMMTWTNCYRLLVSKRWNL